MRDVRPVDQREVHGVALPHVQRGPGHASGESPCRVGDTRGDRHVGVFDLEPEAVEMALLHRKKPGIDRSRRGVRAANGGLSVGEVRWWRCVRGFHSSGGAARYRGRLAIGGRGATGQGQQSDSGQPKRMRHSSLQGSASSTRGVPAFRHQLATRTTERDLSGQASDHQRFVCCRAHSPSNSAYGTWR